MTLEQAIYHLEVEVLPNMPCSECKNEHIQLLEWLKELQELRKNMEKNTCYESKRID